MEDDFSGYYLDKLLICLKSGVVTRPMFCASY